jgi:deoxyribonucleoside regulator
MLNQKMDELVFLSRIAYMYYKEDMDLKSISKIFNTSYVTISRALKKAREIGVVTININNQVSRLIEMENVLKDKLGLKEVYAVNSSEFINNISIVTNEASNYLLGVLKEGDTLGISSGSTIYQVVNNFISVLSNKLYKSYKIDIVQLQGYFPSLPIEQNSMTLVNNMKNMFRGSYYLINSETFVENKEIKNLLLQGSNMRETFSMHKKINIALLGIGSFNIQEISNLYKDCVNPKEILELGNKQAVGENCLHFFDIFGNIIETSLFDRIISINKEDLINIQNKIVIATGTKKAHAIIGSARAKLMDVLITDSMTMEEIIKYLE